MKPARGLGYRLGKRVGDIMVAACGLLLMSPVLVGLCVWPGRVLKWVPLGAYVGRGGRVFERFEAVVGGAGGGTTLARMVRHAPDLARVLSGQISLVGPRPIALAEREAFAAYPARFAVPPGLLCLWWLRRRSNMDFGEEGQADCAYVEQAGWRADAAIVLRAALVWAYGAPAATHAACHRISGIRLLNLSQDDMVAAIMAAITRGIPTQVAFVNPDCVNIAARNAPYRHCLKRADWVCADGIGMKIAGRILGREIRQNVNGTDLFPALCQALSHAGRSIYFLGARPGVAQAVAQWASAQYPGLIVAGAQSGYFNAGDEAQVVADIRRARPDVLLVAMGAPRQEAWLARHLGASGAVVGMGVGGLFDFYSGRIPRAPVWLREMGGEWVYRLCQEPGRMWRRYLIGNGVFLARVFTPPRGCWRRSTSARARRWRRG